MIKFYKPYRYRLLFVVIFIFITIVTVLQIFEPTVATDYNWKIYETNWYLQCGGKPKIKRVSTTFPTSIPVTVKSAVCKNILSNITNGFWRLKKDFKETDIRLLDEQQNNFRKTINIPTILWRSDEKCGTENKLIYGDSSSICNPTGEKSCCTNHRNGVCVSPGSVACQCDECFDSSKIVHADISEWIVQDNRCKWKNYTAKESCAVLNNMQKQDFNHDPHFYFVGDSTMRNLFLGLLIILNENRETGSWKSCLTDELKKLCRGTNQFKFLPCLGVAVGNDLDEVDNGLMCGGEGRHFDATFKSFYASVFADDYLQFVSTLLHKPNTYITMGICLHDSFNYQAVLDKFFRPTVELIKSSKSAWPKLLWVHPQTLSPISPARYWRNKQEHNLKSFTEHIEAYLKKEGIFGINFQKLTQNVHSHDGTHYGLDVNVIKAQIWLNVMATLTKK